MQFKPGGGKPLLHYFLRGKHRGVRDDQPSRFDKAKL